MRSKFQIILDLHISKWKLTLHYFVEVSSRKQSKISEKKNNEGYALEVQFLSFGINTPGSFWTFLIMCTLIKILFANVKQNLHKSEFTYVCKINHMCGALDGLSTEDPLSE